MPKSTFFNLPPEKRQHIVDVALNEFASNDFHNASLSRIVSQAGIAKGSIYQYFDDKRDLYFYLLSLAAQEKAAFLQQHPSDRPANLFDQLRWLFSAGANFQFSNPRLAQLGYRALYDDVMQGPARRQLASGSAEFFRNLARQGMEQGELNPELDQGLVAFVFEALFVNLGNYLLERLAGGQPDPDAPGLSALSSPEAQRLFDDLLSILERGLALRSDGD